MNAKITITLPISKIHLKVGDILEEVASTLESTSIDVTSISKNVLQQIDLVKQLENINEIRKNLALLDANLEDCYSILGGLVKYKTQGVEQKNVEPKPE